MHTHQPTHKKDAPLTGWMLVALCTELGFLIAVPLVVFLLAGIKIDRQFNTAPWAMLSGMGLALASSTVLVARRIKQSTSSL